MKFNITKEEEKKLQQIWKEVLKNFPEDAETDMRISIERYVSDMGLPETVEHEAIAGDELDQYLEDNGLDFEDCRTIIED